MLFSKSYKLFRWSCFDLSLLEKFETFMKNPKDSKMKEYFAQVYAKIIN